MKKIATVLAMAVMLGTFLTGCATMQGDVYQRVKKSEHEAEFPKGHDGTKNCYYDDKNDVYFCQY